MWNQDYKIPHSTCSSNREVTKSLWQAVWKIKVPPKAKICCWRIINDILSNKINLAKKEVHSNLLCLFCRKHVESSIHLMWKCILSKEIWAKFAKKRSRPCPVPKEQHSQKSNTINHNNSNATYHPIEHETVGGFHPIIKEVLPKKDIFLPLYSKSTPTSRVWFTNFPITSQIDTELAGWLWNNIYD